MAELPISAFCWSHTEKPGYFTRVFSFLEDPTAGMVVAAGAGCAILYSLKQRGYRHEGDS